MSRGEAQLYGTQIKRVNGTWIVWPVDHVSDRDRAEWCVEPLAMTKRSAAKMNLPKEKH